MTHEDIFTKFMIEYDKANLTSSYPSLTDYEIATVLDKAYLALIALKLTGTNFRRAGFEVDYKAISDILNLIVRTNLTSSKLSNTVDNEYVFTIPNAFLYYVSGQLQIRDKVYMITLTTHELANTYKAAHNNLPWIPNPVAYVESNKMYTLIDAYDYSDNEDLTLTLEYVKKPLKFVDDYDTKTSTFELNDSMAEELINLAIIMSLEIVESTRLDSKIKTSPLES